MSLRILLVGSDNPWRMEAALTQRWAKWNAGRFKPDFAFLSKCLALDPETVMELVQHSR